MTKQNNATINPTNLNLERMTPKFFYPDVFADDFVQVKIPTIDELRFLGEANVQDIKWYVRREEKKLRSMLQEARKGKKAMALTLNTIQQKCHNPQGEAVSCNWRGLKYADIPEEVVDRIATESTDGDSYGKAYCAEADKRYRKVYACRFGEFVAEWCSMNPQPCQHDLKCDIMKPATIVALAELFPGKTKVHLATPALEQQPTKCPHYDECFGIMPYKEKKCIFATANQALLENCRSYLRQRVSDVEARLEIIDKYVNNITKALKDSDIRPAFGLDNKLRLQGLSRDNSSNRIVEFRWDGSIEHGTFVYVMKDKHTEQDFVLLNMDDGRVLKLPLSSGYTANQYLNEGDCLYLATHPDYCQVWLQMSYDPDMYPAEPEIVKALEALTTK